jgi:hypothetical protein
MTKFFYFPAPLSHLGELPIDRLLVFQDPIPAAGDALLRAHDAQSKFGATQGHDGDTVTLGLSFDGSMGLFRRPVASRKKMRIKGGVTTKHLRRNASTRYAIKARYAAFDPFYFAIAIGSLPMFALGGLKIGGGSDPQGGLPSSVERLGDHMGAWSVVLIVPGLLLGAVACRFWLRIFPRGTFAIGYGKNRHDKLESIRGVVIAGFLLSLLANILMSPYVLDSIRRLIESLYY